MESVEERPDWLLTLLISFAIYFRAARAGFARRNIVIAAGINELTSPVLVNYFTSGGYLASGGYSSRRSTVWKIPLPLL